MKSPIKRTLRGKEKRVKKYELPPGYKIKAEFKMDYKEKWVVAYSKKSARIYSFVFVPKLKTPIRIHEIGF